MIDPGFKGIFPRAKLVNHKAACPKIVVKGLQGRSPPATLALLAEENAAGDMVMPIAEGRASDLHLVAEDSLGGMAATIDLRLDFFNHDAFATLDRFHAFQSTV